MKIWIPALKVGTGADVYFADLAGALSRCGVPAALSLYPPRLEFCPWLLACVVTEPGADIIHASCDYAFPFAGRGVPLVVTLFHWVHGADYALRRTVLQRLYHRLLVRRRQERSLRAADAVTTISGYSARRLRDALPDLKPRVIYPGIDTDYFCPGPVRAPDGVFRLLFVGTPSRRKGFDLLPRIAAALGPGFEVRYTAGTAFPGIANLHRTGALGRAELREAYRRCDALLFPTRYEGFGLVAAEAMACGKPVIASRCTSLPELVEDGVTGILCPVDDVDAFAAAARRLAAAPEECAAMGSAGRARVLERFTLARMAQEYIALYRALGARAGTAKQGEKP